jgi:hypothetical protein
MLPFDLRIPLFVGRALEEKTGSMKLRNLQGALAGPKMAYLFKITSAFEFSVLTLTVLGLGLSKS